MELCFDCVYHGYNYIERFIAHMWSYVATPEVFYHKEDYYMVKFQSKDDMKEILFTGPYSINNRPLILKPWTPDFEMDVAFLVEIPLWVKFPNLSMSCWSDNSLSMIGSAISIPLYVDECTTKQSRIFFARVLNQTNVTKPLPDGIVVCAPDGGVLHQVFTYDWKLEFCEKFQMRVTVSRLRRLSNI
ncbi:hypothetical protein R3W88_024937 [Solanum pinnatisectum]|uniref:DUF4283 domain-containing protein n=1 Tax=Solanum pinnatisectum TaxID=50273 RepID=A0AAV9M203_9SOLN|nr:hypothetical protein R3W88_024937 [Solanum pinnatisectum]